MDIFVILGAAVLADGEPSGALRRRVEGAFELSRNSRDAAFLVTGGGGSNRPTEAAAMSALLEAKSVAPERIFQDPVSKNTLSSVVQCARIIKSQNCVHSVVVCSDRYHIPRCRWLFYLLGVPTLAGDMPSGLAANGYLRWACYYVREAAALVPDTVALLFGRLRRESALSSKP
jgi:vancomycin permeability regulator SanA